MSHLFTWPKVGFMKTHWKQSICSLGLTWASLAMLSPLASASSFDLLTTDATLKTVASESHEGNADLLIVSPPNSEGISVNYFSTFEVQDQPLQLINMPTDQPAASLIVIIGDEITLRNAVEVVGTSSDVLLLNTQSQGDIECTNCRFENIHRVSLVAAQAESGLDSSITEVGVLTPSNSRIQINNLQAPGAISVDILSSTLALAGEINTQLKATKDISGSYQVDPDGDYIVGAGEVNINLGAIAWHYDNHEIIGLSNTSATFELNGAIKSSGVKVSAAGDMVFKTQIDTRSDLLSPIQYRDSVYMPKERVLLQSFADGKLTLMGDLISAGEVKIKSKDSVFMPQRESLWVSNILEIIAEHDVLLMGEVHADSIGIAGNNVVNEGEIWANTILQVWAQNTIANQYGGLISADTLRMKSVLGVVRNGSRTPYLSNAYELAGYFALRGGDLPSYDPMKMGAYYGLATDLSSASSNRVMPADSSAKIVANDIGIEADAFENINPYYEFAAGEADPVLAYDKEDQVSLIAERALAILAQRYVLNASAWMVLRNTEGALKIEANQVNNERYRVVNMLASQSDYAGTRSYIDSPPGVLISMGDLEITAKYSYVNNISYFETYGNASMYSPLGAGASFNVFGLDNEGYSSAGVSTVSLLMPYVGTQSQGLGIYHASSSQPQNQSVSSLKFSEANSLFFVHGDFLANVPVQFQEHNPLDTYIGQIVSAALQETEDRHTTIYKGGSSYQLQAVGYDTNYVAMEQQGKSFHGYIKDGRKTRFYFDELLTNTNSLDAIKASGQVDVNWKSNWRKIIFRTDMPVSNTARNIEPQTKTGTDTYSLFDELKALYNQVASSITELFQEVKWWG